MDEKTIIFIVSGIIIILFALYIIKVKYKQKNNDQLHVEQPQTVEAKNLFVQQGAKKNTTEEITANEDNVKKLKIWVVSGGYEQDVEELKKQNNKTNIIVKQQQSDGGFFQATNPTKNVEEKTESDEQTNTDGFNLLIVDDSFTVRKKLQNLLTKSGYNITLKNDGFDAVTYLQTASKTKAKPDLIITDIEMPKMNGFQFIDWLKQSSQYNSLPIMVISAHVELHLKLMESGTIDGFISKPFNDADLLVQLEYLLTRN